MNFLFRSADSLCLSSRSLEWRLHSSLSHWSSFLRLKVSPFSIWIKSINIFKNFLCIFIWDEHYPQWRKIPSATYLLQRRYLDRWKLLLETAECSLMFRWSSLDLWRSPLMMQHWRFFSIDSALIQPIREPLSSFRPAATLSLPLHMANLARDW